MHILNYEVTVMENEKDVKTGEVQDSSPEVSEQQTVQDVNNVEDTSTQQTTADASSVDITADTPTSEGDADVSLYDDRGVSWQNVAMEKERKLNNLYDKIPGMIQEAVKSAMPQKEDTKYTIEQLEQFAQERPEYRVWAEQEKEKLRQDSFRKTLNAELDRRDAIAKAEYTRKRVLSEVQADYPECFAKDSAGNIIGWAAKNPQVQIAAQIMQYPRFANDPEGLKAAMEIAYARVARTKATATKKEVQTLKAEKKQLQKQTLVEGGNVQATPDSPSATKAAINRLKESKGTEKDAHDAVRAILRAQGFLAE